MEIIYTVSQLVLLIKENLEKKFSKVTLVGEISNYKPSSSGHLYFTIVDENAQMACCLFRPEIYRNPQIRSLKDGDMVECEGPLSVYSKRGTFQLIVKKIKKVGEGSLKEKFEQLKSKLQREGLFDLERKKMIPTLPNKVAVITALKGAALQDFLNVYQRRCHRMNVVIVPSL